jgi:hypothetical protein
MIDLFRGFLNLKLLLTLPKLEFSQLTSSKVFYFIHLSQWFSTFFSQRHLLAPNFFHDTQPLNCVWSSSLISTTSLEYQYISTFERLQKKFVKHHRNKKEPLNPPTKLNNINRKKISYFRVRNFQIWYFLSRHTGEFRRHTKVSRHPVWETLI